MAKYTEAKKASNRKWDEANLDRISVALPKGDKERIKAAAAAAGKSMNGYIVQLIQRDQEDQAFDTGKKRLFECSACGYGVSDIYLSDERTYLPEEPEPLFRFCPWCGRGIRGSANEKK